MFASLKISAKNTCLLIFTLKELITFDAVYYVFAHREELDFSSLLDGNNIISLTDDAILSILHAHTRTSVISNFCLQHRSLIWIGTCHCTRQSTQIMWIIQ